ncbi:unnamed protein product [Caenorhabditis bovis]|uniref:Piwi domain-containing protein n=1 Tax=Caenorhabditis bovis TaxID=2654633 RepID=A0A8S1FF75_9PELO|nr:unnamed protein product [Caenorhabditis bovis]
MNFQCNMVETKSMESGNTSNDERQIVDSLRSLEDIAKRMRNIDFNKSLKSFAHSCNGITRYFYDQQSSFYTLKKLNENKYGINVPVEEVTSDPDVKKVIVELLYDKSINVDDETIRETAKKDPSPAGKSLIEALRVIVSHRLIINEDVATVNNSVHYVINSDDIVHFMLKYRSKTMRTGLSVNIKTLENRQTPQLYLVIDVKKTLFHLGSQPLIDKLRDLTNALYDIPFTSSSAKYLLKQVFNMSCYVFHQKSKTLLKDAPVVVIKGFGPPASSKLSEFHSPHFGRVDVQTYYKRKYGITLAFPHLMTVKAKCGNTFGLFPIEVLTVCEDQPVSDYQLTERERRDVVKEATMTPAERWKQIGMTYTYLKMNRQIETIYGLWKIGHRSMKVESRKLTEPIIEVPDSAISIHTTSAKLLYPVTLKNWWIVFLETPKRKFVPSLLSSFMRCGIRALTPGEIEIQRYSDVTPHLSNSKCCYIGIDTKQMNFHTNTPYTIGYAANVFPEDRFMFAGGFMYVKKDDDQFGPAIAEALLEIIRTSLHNGVKPNELIIYINGIPESHWPIVADKYTRYIKRVCEAVELQILETIKLTLFFVSKDHIERLFKLTPKRERANDTGNIDRGTVVDKTMVNPLYNEFFLSSHESAQSTSKTPKYTLVYNEPGKTLEELEEMTFHLCFTRKSPNDSTLFPIPVMAAIGYAKRARTAYANSGFFPSVHRDRYNNFVAMCNEKLAKGRNEMNYIAT